MLRTEKEKAICRKYGSQDETGHVHCSECPLVRPSPYNDMSCKATSHYDRHLKEWVPDGWENEGNKKSRAEAERQACTV